MNCRRCLAHLRGYCDETNPECKYYYGQHLSDLSYEYKERLYLDNLNGYEYDKDDDIDMVLHRITGMKY